MGEVYVKLKNDYKVFNQIAHDTLQKFKLVKGVDEHKKVGTVKISRKRKYLH
jgi:hypothetical protein